MVDSTNASKSSRGRKVVLRARAVAGFIVFIIVALFGFRPRERPVIHSKEAVLKIDLMTMREAIDKYTLDKQKPPESLQDLVEAKYLRAIPVDPMTNQRDWKVEFTDVPLSPSPTVNGVTDVHSSSKKLSPQNGTRYDTW